MTILLTLQSEQNSMSTVAWFDPGMLIAQLDKNNNTAPMKKAVNSICKTVEDRAYWYFTAPDGEFLNNVYENQVDENALRNRILQITEEKFDELEQQIMSGKLKRNTESPAPNIADRLNELAENVVINGSDYFSPNHPKTRETKEKLQQLHQDFRQFKDKIQNTKRKQREKSLEKEVMEQQIKKSIDEERKAEYREEVKKKIQNQKLMVQERAQHQKKFQQFLHQYKKTKPLHQLMEQQYKDKVELPQIKESLMKLEEYKVKKPSLEEINEHQRKYLERKARETPKPHIVNQTIDVSYRSQFYDRERQKQKEDLEDSTVSQLKNKIEQRKKYSVMVKEKHKPKIKIMSEDNSKSEKDLPRKELNREEIYMRGLGNLDFVKGLQKKSKEAEAQEGDEHIIKSSRYVNYLTQFKESHNQQLHGLGSNWQHDMRSKTYSKIQKRQTVLMKSRQLEEKAMLNERYITNNSFSKPEEVLRKKKEIDETLISAIRAKIAILEDAKKD